MNDNNSRVSDAEDWDASFTVLVLRYLEGSLGPEEFEEFQLRLKTSRQACSQLAEIAFQENAIREGCHAAFAEVAESQIESLAHSVFASSSDTDGQGEGNIPIIQASNIWWRIGGFVPWVLLLGLGLVFFGRADSAKETSVARIRQSVGSDLNSHLKNCDGSYLFAGDTISFATGLVEVEFGNGALVVLTGPAKMRVDSTSQATLFFGGLSANVKEQAQGFTVISKDARVVDLGTEFSMIVGKDGSTQVKVNSGAVDVFPFGGEKTRMTKGQSGLVNSLGDLLPIERATNAFSRIAESFGKPDYSIPAHQDSFVMSGQWADIVMHDYPTGDELELVTHQHDLLVKHEMVLTEFNRQAVVGFDLSDVPRDRLLGARLTLTTTVNDLAYIKAGDSHIPDPDPNWQFVVSGVWDQGIDGWTEESLVWSNAPGIDPESISGEMIGPDSPMELGCFFLLGPMVNGKQVSVDGKRLADFLRLDDDGKVTFLIRRVTGTIQESGSYDLTVHSFASREHKTLPPPTLELWIKK